MDPDFAFNPDGLARAVELLGQHWNDTGVPPLPLDWPAAGLGSGAVLEQMAPLVLGGAGRLGQASAFAHMDPPTPWLSWAATLWNAALNQNLLHPATAPVARDIEARVVAWLAPFFGMDGGHLTPGSTVANLTALWAARECAGIQEVLASQSAHLSVQKAAHLLGLRFRGLPVDPSGALHADALDGDLSRSALVLTAGTTSTGAVDPLCLAGRAAWTHVDAAWAGPLRLSPTHALRLAGIEAADSVAVSAHNRPLHGTGAAVGRCDRAGCPPGAARAAGDWRGGVAAGRFGVLRSPVGAHAAGRGVGHGTGRHTLVPQRGRQPERRCCPAGRGAGPRARRACKHVRTTVRPARLDRRRPQGCWQDDFRAGLMVRPLGATHQTEVLAVHRVRMPQPSEAGP
ncbi:MAG: pyridoxal-dependent decarboxylase [Rubrivivax sp.]|nr:pyridoxal-dependent decarboxylase [Rubrivivax sp.]